MGSDASGQQLHMQPAIISDPEKFNGSINKLHSFVSHLYIKLEGDTCHFPNPQHQLCFTCRLLVGQVFAKVEAYSTLDSIN
jgi:hypothetical protein